MAGGFDAPCRTKNIAREIPPSPWYRSMTVHMAIGGFLPFRSVPPESGTALHLVFCAWPCLALTSSSLHAISSHVHLLYHWHILCSGWLGITLLDLVHCFSPLPLPSPSPPPLPPPPPPSVQYLWNYTTSLRLFGVVRRTLSMEFFWWSSWFSSASRLAFLSHWPTFSSPQRTTAGGGGPSSHRGEWKKLTFLSHSIFWWWVYTPC